MGKRWVKQRGLAAAVAESRQAKEGVCERARSAGVPRRAPPSRIPTQLRERVH